MRGLVLLFLVLCPFALQARSLPIADPQMVAALAALTPDLPDWTCGEPEGEAVMHSMGPYLPMAVTECRHESASIILLVAFDPDFASTTCARLRRDFDRQSENADSGTVAFEKGEGWVSERTSRGFWACSADQIVVQAKSLGTAGRSGDGTALDLFHKALISRDTANVLSLASESKRRLDEAFSILDAETHELELLLPRPDGWEITDSILARMERLEQDRSSSLPTIMRLMGLPTVGHTLLRGDCRIQISLSAAPEVMHDAGVTFAKSGIRDGVTGSFWRNRKTDRLYGQEALDGSRYQMVIDNSVVLRIDAMGDCSREDGVATSLYEAIKSEDMSRFRLE